ncbi:DNA photolyase family protein [bacterium]|nr:DNA photolyase family protein [bacterium]
MEKKLSREAIAIYWVRKDLRLEDNPALVEAALHRKVLPVFILDEKEEIGAASKWWLHYSLQSLSSAFGGSLSIFQGNPLTILKELVERNGGEAVYWNRCYTPYTVARDKIIKEALPAKSFNGSLLFEPWEIKKDNGEPYKVFTPFFKRGCLGAGSPRKPLPIPEKLQCIKDDTSLSIEDLQLLPTIPWDKEIKKTWKVGEEGAKKRFSDFLKEGISSYKEGRDFPAKPFVSRLSPYVHFGEISPNTLWYGAQKKGANKDIDHFLRELGWREFSYSLLFHNPSLPARNLQEKFDRFPWIKNKEHLLAWKKGKTGIPFVDAGMRELWQTGYMHNRVRMVVASYLVKNLRIDWREGAAHFFDCLVDADLANNSASWQWVAGCGADAAPYFRIFNPVTQGQKFDPEGEYVRKYVSELSKLPNKYLFSPWETPVEVLEIAGVELGKEYPEPLVDLKVSRAAALSSYERIKS